MLGKAWGHRSTAAVLLAIAGVMGAAGSSASAAILWGLDTDDDQLFTLDTGSGVVNEIGTLPAFDFGGLDFDGSGNLYALLDTVNGSELFLVNPNDASAVSLGASSKVFESFEIMAGTAYSADVFEENLYSVSLLDGSPTLIGSHDTDAGDNRITGLASDGTNLFGTRHFDLDLVQLNTGTGGVDSIIGVHGLSDASNLAYGDGKFWTIPAFSQTLYSLSAFDASATLEFSGLSALGHVTGLTTPEPATLSLLALSGLALMRRRRG
jgi:hypothetical protein